MPAPQRFFLWLGCAVFTLLGVMAVYFYQERMLFSDMAFQTFHILRTGHLQIQSGRFGAAGTQVFPWAAQAIGMPLKSVLVSYSLGHVLYYFLLFLFTHVVLRQWRWAAAIALTAVLMTTHTFYWLSEAPQGLAFLLVLMAWTDGKPNLRSVQWWQWPLWITGVVTAFYFHPMIMYAMVFIAGLMLLHTRTAGKRWVWVTGLIFLACTVIAKYKILQLDWYDAMSLTRAEAFRQLWPHWIDIRSNRDFVQWVWRDYYLLPVMYVVNLVLLLRKKQWLPAAWCAAFPPAYILLVNIPFHDGDRQFYLENLYLPLAVFAVLPFLWQVFPTGDTVPSRLRWWYTAILLTVVIRIFHIYQAHSGWTARLNWEKAFLQDHPAPKVLVPEKTLPADVLQFTWGLPYESLLLTALPHPDSARTVFQYSEMTPPLDSLARLPGVFLGTFKHYPQQELPGRYFRLQEVGYR